eukprot:1581134-Alexandrium_andersonii.AAC.2
MGGRTAEGLALRHAQRMSCFSLEVKAFCKCRQASVQQGKRRRPRRQRPIASPHPPRSTCLRR